MPHEDDFKYGQHRNNVHLYGKGGKPLSIAQANKLLAEIKNKKKKPKEGFTLEELKIVRKTILEKGLKYKYVAKNIGLDPVAFCFLLSGDRKYYNKKEEICKFLGITFDKQL